MTTTRRVALVTNPTAGKGRGAKAREVALTKLRAAGVEVVDVVGDDAESAAARARAAIDDQHEKVDALVAVGGDGLVHLAVQVVAGTGTPLGIVPAGTGNDVARYVDLPRGDADAASERLVDALTHDRTRTLDLARTGTGTWFTTVLCAGFDAAVNERANAMTRPRGQLRYTLATVAELRTFRPLPYTLVLDGEEQTFEAMMVSIGNGPSFGGGLRITEGAHLDDGLLDVVVIGPMSKPDLLRTYPKLFKGTHTTHPQYRRHVVRRVEVSAPGIVAYADGERIGPLPMSVEAVPGALRVLA